MRSHTLKQQTLLLGLLAADLVCVIGAYVTAFALRLVLPLPFTEELLPVGRLIEVYHPIGFLLVTQGVVLYFFSLYDLHLLRLRGRVVFRVLAAGGFQLVLTAAWYFFRGDIFFPRSVLILFWLLNASMIGILRVGLIQRLRRTRPLRILLVGAAQDVQSFLDVLPALSPFPEVQVVGLVSLNRLHSLNGNSPSPLTASALAEDASAGECQPLSPTLCKDFDKDPDKNIDGDLDKNLGVPWLGSADELERIVHEVPVDDIILLASATWKDAFVERLLSVSNGRSDERRPRVLVVPSIYDILVGRVASVRLQDVPLVEAIKDPHEELAFLVKNIFDRLIAGGLLILSLPILIVAAVLISATSPGPVFYRQQRVGKGGGPFTVYKLRTMVDRAEAETGPVLASPADQRVTRVGRWLRDSRMDEVPQLWNVINGTMSLVGPRPERPEFAEEYLHTVPGYAERFQVKPGLTGLAQVNGEYHTTPEYKLKYDLAYMYNYSLLLDIRILADTVKVMLTRRGI